MLLIVLCTGPAYLADGQWPLPLKYPIGRGTQRDPAQPSMAPDRCGVP